MDPRIETKISLAKIKEMRNLILPSKIIIIIIIEGTGRQFRMRVFQEKKIV